MNHQSARQIADGPNAGKWHWTEANSRTGTHAIGYCGRFQTCPECDSRSFITHVECGTCGVTGYVDVGDAQCAGHDTPEEAAEHYRQYLLTERLRLDGMRSENQQFRCEAEGCDEWTQTHAHLGSWLMWALCDAHRTRETVEVLYPKVGESWSS